MTDEPTVLAARINARQAIIVALITAATTLLAAWFVRAGVDSGRFGWTGADSPRSRQQEPINTKAKTQKPEISTEELSTELDKVTKALRNANARLAAMSSGAAPDLSKLRSEAAALRNENNALRTSLTKSRDDSAHEISDLRSSLETLRRSEEHTSELQSRGLISYAV